MKNDAKQAGIYVKLEEDDFLVLVSGGRVNKTDREGNEVHLILSDIGWDRMLKSIHTTMGGEIAQ